MPNFVYRGWPSSGNYRIPSYISYSLWHSCPCCHHLYHACVILSATRYTMNVLHNHLTHNSPWNTGVTPNMILGVTPNMMLAINSFPVKIFSPDNSLTFGQLPDSCQILQQLQHFMVSETSGPLCTLSQAAMIRIGTPTRYQRQQRDYKPAFSWLANVSRWRHLVGCPSSSVLMSISSWGRQFFTCGGPSSSLSRANRAADIDRPLMPSPHSFSALKIHIIITFFCDPVVSLLTTLVVQAKQSVGCVCVMNITFVCNDV